MPTIADLRFLLTLTPQEREVLRAAAMQEAVRQDDLRYRETDPAERARVQARWKQIVDTLA